MLIDKTGVNIARLEFRMGGQVNQEIDVGFKAGDLESKEKVSIKNG